MGTQIAIVNASIRWRTVHTGEANNGAFKVSNEVMSGILMVGIPIRIIRISIAFINKYGANAVSIILNFEACC